MTSTSVSSVASVSSTGGGTPGGTGVSQLQARLSQPPTGGPSQTPAGAGGVPGVPGAAPTGPGGTTNREQLRFLLQRGPSAVATAVPATAATTAVTESQISLSTATTSTGVTTTRVWVPGEDLDRGHGVWTFNKNTHHKLNTLVKI